MYLIGTAAVSRFLFKTIQVKGSVVDDILSIHGMEKTRESLSIELGCDIIRDSNIGINKGHI